MTRSLLLKATARAKSAGGIDSLVRCNPYIRRRVLLAIRRMHDSDAGFLEVERQLCERIAQAARRTPYGSGRPDDLAAWPILEKEALRASPRDFVDPSSLIRVPAGTGGTTGVPLKLWRSIESIVAEQVFIDRLLRPHGFSMHDSRVAVLRADTVKPTTDTEPPYGRISHGGKRLTLSSPHLAPRTLPWFHNALRQFAPEVLWVYPSAAVNLLTLLRRADLRLAVPIILASSETLAPAAHRALEGDFQAKVINYYGQAERVCFASSTRAGEFYFEPGYGRVELATVGDSGLDGELRMKIIGTPYWNRAMPLVRYDTGDLIQVPSHYRRDEIEAVAVGKRPFTAILGREGEYVLTRDGLRIIGMNQIPREVEHVTQMQIVQRDYETVEIHVLALPGYGSRDAEKIRDQAMAKVPGSMNVTVRTVERLQMTARGKTPAVVRTFPQDGG